MEKEIEEFQCVVCGNMYPTYSGQLEYDPVDNEEAKAFVPPLKEGDHVCMICWINNYDIDEETKTKETKETRKTKK